MKKMEKTKQLTWREIIDDLKIDLKGSPKGALIFYGDEEEGLVTKLIGTPVHTLKLLNYILENEIVEDLIKEVKETLFEEVEKEQEKEFAKCLMKNLMRTISKGLTKEDIASILNEDDEDEEGEEE